jgi:hypothetical protein
MSHLRREGFLIKKFLAGIRILKWNSGSFASDYLGISARFYGFVDFSFVLWGDCAGSYTDSE